MLKSMRNEKGFTLIEVIIALAFLGIIAVAFLGALFTASDALVTADSQATAESLARSQMEHVKTQAYDSINNPPQYTLLTDIPDGYDIEIVAERLDPQEDGFDDDDGIQKITVRIYFYDEDNPILELEDYKVER